MQQEKRVPDKNQIKCMQLHEIIEVDMHIYPLDFNSYFILQCHVINTVSAKWP